VKKLIFILLLIIPLVLSAQQINYSLGLKATSGDPWTVAGITYLDTATTYDFIFDLNDYYFWDYNPLVISDSTDDVAVNSNLMYLGTFYANFNCQNAADSVILKLDVFPGLYGVDSRAVASVVWGDTVELETIRCANDYFDIQNIYVHATKYKILPPELLMIRLRDVTDGDQDDSIQVDWKFAYPAIIHQVKERKQDN